VLLKTLLYLQIILCCGLFVHYIKIMCRYITIQIEERSLTKSIFFDFSQGKFDESKANLDKVKNRSTDERILEVGVLEKVVLARVVRGVV
jgi:hypothetical protein